ncbi:MAG TPA: biotin--[acetyl-CoA-carboxylase] ligase [Dermatophilaceae bacterium]|nr:biotin--[acetyl-CoA-carboxylase] ligase [Dermatophilaceae bacterium]
MTSGAWLDAAVLRQLLDGTPWAPPEVHDSIDSTNAEALRRPEVWRVVAAGHQRAGRGRLDRSWESAAGRSAAISVVVPAPAARPQDWAWLPLLTGLAMCEAVGSVTGVAAALKWPNDVLARRRPDAYGDPEAPDAHAAPGDAWGKVAGVLVEMAGAAPVAVAGAGLNLSHRRDELPVPTATSLALCGAASFGVERLLAAYLRRLADLVAGWLAGGPALEAGRAAYRARCATIGTQVTVHLPDGPAAPGAAVAVDDDGRLVLRRPGGTTRYAAGDIQHARGPAKP